VNSVLEAVGLGSLRQSWLSDTHLVLYSVIAPNVWQYVGFYVVIMLAGMRGIPSEHLDAASLDGASRTRMLTAIVVPSIREIIVICMILVVTGAIRAFDHAWVMTQGGPGVASSFFSVLVFRGAFIDYQFGYASAVATTVLVYSLVITVIMRRFLIRDADRLS
jgi:raffinose/stachyose/melibiose transport system permease protein